MKNWLLCASSIVIIGCASSSHIITGQAKSPVAPETVKVYSALPPGAEVIATVTGSCDSSWTFQRMQDRAIASMKKDAAKLGANGLVIGGADQNAWTGATVSAQAVYVKE